MPKPKNAKPAAKTPARKAAPAARPPAKKETKVQSRTQVNPQVNSQVNHVAVLTPPRKVDIKDPFLKRQKERLLQLRDGMLDSMTGVARDTLRSRAEGSEASAFGMHQADAGSDAYDRDFALSLLSQEQDALYEIDEALKRIELGTYGICELSGKPILHARLEAIPFARYTVECQSQLEKQRKMSRSRQPVTSLFGLTDDEGGASEGEEEETVTETKE
ncbi:MAG: TraR/DksA C4-type zinc finger protein [Chthoniobacteraceae bacterium]|jgi:RNA polymerase-binding transcription factor DksA